MLVEENTSRGDSNLEERYQIMVGAEHDAGEFGRPANEGSLQLSPVFQMNDTEMNRLSEIHTPEAGETSIQELAQENGNLVQNEGDEDLDECQTDRVEAEADVDEDYFFPSPEEMEMARPPEVGMVFPTLQAAHRFISIYGQVTGFSVIKGTNYKHQKITFQCNKSRKAKETGTRQRKRRRDAVVRTGCRMKVVVKLVAEQWEVRAVVNEHNHPLWCSPSLTRFFMSHKYMPEHERNFSRILQESRIKPIKIMEIFRKLMGRCKNIPVTKMDVNSLEQCDRLMKTRNTDVETTLEYVKRLQKEQPGFYYTIRTDEDNTVRSIFWTDGRARLDYALYGDFISFDTTYRTTENIMPFTPLTGINGHGKTTVFGCALLENDKAETISWLLRIFLDVMDGKKPSIIMTNQDTVMQESIAEVFPTVFHRFSMWHVMREAAAEFGGFMVNRPGMQDQLTRLVTDSLTTEEFEVGWKAMVEKYSAESNAHLRLMYQTRSMWVPVYFKHVFCPFIRSFGRSDGTNSIFNDHVLREDTVDNFISQYQIFQEVLSTEDINRVESTLKKTVYCTRQPIERHAADIYTTGLFLKFQKELLDASAFNVSEEGCNTYTVKKMLDYEEAEFLGESFSVEVELETKMFNCICSKFERDGILCCHILRLFTQFGINALPEHYIKQRWTKKFREQELQNCIENTRSNGSQNALRYAVLMSRVTGICATVSKDANQSKLFLDDLERIQQKLTCRE
ncbi:hypothetical protein ACP4OV_030424 [Aristida adscensionis]